VPIDGRTLLDADALPGNDFEDNCKLPPQFMLASI
jgi:hypothetical protein